MLLELMRTHAAAALDAEDWSACAAALNASTVEILDPTPVTYSLIRERFGEPVRLLVANTVRAAAQQNGDMADAHQLLLNGGLRLDLPERQQALQALAVAGNWSQQVLTNLAGLGRRMTSSAAAAGLRNVTAQQCLHAWRSELLTRRLRELREAFDARTNEALQLINQSDITSVNSLRAFLATVTQPVPE